MSTIVPLHAHSASLTDPGKVRKHNEDACLEHVMSGSGLWVVADGMGGHESGEVASGMIIESMRNVQEPHNLGEFIDTVESHLLDVHDALCTLSAKAPQPATIGSTVVVLLAFKNQGACLWAGDSRLYHYGDRALSRLTRDHSEVEDLVQQGLLLAEDAETHPAANVLTSAVGASERLQLDVKFQPLSDGERYLLCSDGLYRELSEDDIAQCLDARDVDTACKDMVALALERGCKDNVSVVVVEFTASA